MNPTRWLISGLANLFRRARLEREMHDEIAFHIETRATDLMAKGQTHDEAHRLARIEFGSAERYREEHRDARRIAFLSQIGRDVVHSWRSLRRSPALVIISVLSLGLGIGVNTTLFSAVDAIFLFRPTIVDRDRVVIVEPGNADQFSYLNYRDLQDSDIFERVAGYRRTRLHFGLGAQVSRINGIALTANYFETLGITAARGRVFAAGEAALENNPRVAVLGHRFWQRQFQENPDVVQQTIVLNGQPFAVIGVLPPTFRDVMPFDRFDVYVPLSPLVLANLEDRRNGNALTVLARLKPGNTPAETQAAVTTLGQRMEQAYPEQNEGFSRPARITPVASATTNATPSELVVFPVFLSLLFAMVLLIACANVAGLLLARSATRGRELALRTALGASRATLVQTLLTESFLLATTGATAGIVAALWLMPILRERVIPGLGDGYLFIEPNRRVWMFALALTAITGLVCGLVPALKATRRRFMSMDLHHDTSANVTARLRLRHAFVVAQVAASLTLLVVSTLFLQSLLRVATFNPGFDIDRGLVVRVDLQPTEFAADGGLSAARRLVERIEGVAGVHSASVATIVPLGGDGSATSFQIDGRPAANGAETYLNNVGPRYFETMGIPIRQGRDFRQTDNAATPSVVMVNEAFAKAYFGTESPLGMRVGLGGRYGYSEIIGVVADSKYGFAFEPPAPLLYYAFAQHAKISSQVRDLVIHVRSDLVGPAALTTALKTAVAAVQPDSVVRIQTLHEATSFEASLWRVGAIVLGSLGAVGLLLAMIGLYGVMAFVVASRTSEIGVRMALGASMNNVLRDVLAQGVKLLLMGIVVGAAIAFAVMRLLASAIAALRPADPLTFAAAALLLAIIGIFACYIPARRAARIEPVVALRES